MKLSTILFLLMLLSISCEKEITIDLKQHSPSICINCIIEAGADSILIEISKTQSIDNSEEFSLIDNATIQLKEDGKLLSGISYQGKGLYLTNHRPVEGKEYSITVNVPDYQPLSAKTVVPYYPKANVAFVNDTVEDKMWPNGFRIVPKFNVRLNDLPDNNYYWIILAKIYMQGNNIRGNFNTTYKTDYLGFDDFNRYYVQDNSYPFTNYEYIGILRLTDTDFKNKSIEFSISALNSGDLYVISFDKHFDRYYKTSIKQFLIYEYDELPVFEPIQIYSNIKNGFGIFGAMAIFKYSVKSK